MLENTFVIVKSAELVGEKAQLSHTMSTSLQTLSA